MPEARYYATIRNEMRTGSLKWLSECYCEIRDESGEGCSTFGTVDVKIAGTTEVIGHISYNGRIWSGPGGRHGLSIPLCLDDSKLIYDNRRAVEAKLAALIRKAETGEQWAEIALIEDRDLVPLQNPSARVELLAAYERIEELELVLRGAQVLIEAIHGLDVNGTNEAMLTKIYEVLQ